MDFVVLKVNGKDVSSATHEETVAAFSSAKEPIIVEVLKRPFIKTAGGPEVGISTNLCDTSTQTEVPMFWDPHTMEFSPIVKNNSNQQGTTQTSLRNDVSSHYCTIERDGEDDEGCDVEYEEVTLHRNPKGAKLGLTLCYGAPDEPDTDIYISEIDPESVAAKDGRIQEGDQLLQINGFDVRSRTQAVSLFAESRSDFTLLLARPQIPEHEEDDITTDTGTTENAYLEKDSGVGKTDESTKNDESSDHDAGDIFSFSGNASSGHYAPLIRNSPSIQDSDGFGNDLAAREDFQRFQTQLTNKGISFTPLCRIQSDASLDREMALLNKEMENIQLECENLVHQHLESQQKGSKGGDKNEHQLEHVYVNVADLNITKDDRGNTVVWPFNKQETVEKWVNSMVFPSKKFPENQDSSSAYNTADSSTSLPLTLELTPVPIQRGEIYGSVMSLVSTKMEDKGTQLRESDVSSLFSCDSCRRCCKALIDKKLSSVSNNYAVDNNVANNSGSNNKKAPQNKSYQSHTEKELNTDRSREEKNKNSVPFFPPLNTMYTNQANLQHTIWLQQQMLQQALVYQKLAKNGHSSFNFRGPNISSHFRVDGSSNNIALSNKIPTVPGNYSINNHHLSSVPKKSTTLSTVREEEEIKMEWKVKKRADGTRYITRRPVRNRLLKARAMKILEERTGITTDDDAISEMKTGRYWSKEERKRHLEKARDRKKKELVIRSKIANGKEDGDDSKKEINILELSHKKMLRRQGKIVFDDFTTVQEVLAHGAKVTGVGGKPLGLLTVTTV